MNDVILYKTQNEGEKNLVLALINLSNLIRFLSLQNVKPSSIT